MKKLRVYVEFGETTIFFPEKQTLRVYRDPEAHSKVRARVLELQIYNCKFRLGKSAWVFAAETIAAHP